MTYFITDTDRTNALLDALESREREVEHYQVNINNFSRIVAKPATPPEFVEELKARLAAELAGQARAQAVLDVILEQLEGKDIPALIAARPKKE